MEYSLYINQLRAIEWELSMGEALLFSYLISSVYWMSEHPTHSKYRWCANAKLANELPLVCKHKDSAKRHMITLEQKGLINRMVSGNKSYFMITDKGAMWKSRSILESDGFAPPAESRTDSPQESDGFAPLGSDGFAPQSDIPINQIKREDKKTLPPEYVDMVLRVHEETLPELVSVTSWKSTQNRAKHLLKIYLDESIETTSEDFWRAYFLHVRTNDWWMGRDVDANGKPKFKASFEFLVHPTQFLRIFEECIDIDKRRSAV